MMPNARLRGKWNPSVECDTDSNPTNAHGVSARMQKTCATPPLPGAKAGENTPSNPPRRPSTAASATRMPPIRSSESTVCARAARVFRPRQQLAPTTASTPTHSATSPAYTS